MKRTIFLMTVFSVLMGLTMQAQNKAEQVKQIRQLYADAKQRIAQNGKGGAAPLDVTIHRFDTTAVSEDFIVEEESDMKIYFSKVPTSDSWYEDVPYFISHSWSADGHTNYREMLYDPKRGHLIFSYMKAETHAGFVVETRYYYDDKGQLIDQKHKVGGADATPNAHSWNTWDSDLKLGREWLQQFKWLTEREDGNSMTVGNRTLNVTKDNRMKMIRSNYSKAKNQVAKLQKSDYASGVNITIHDQSDLEGPPNTREYKFFFDKIRKSDGEMKPHCYFFTEHYKSMYMDSYEEFLFHPTADNLLFYYDKSHEEDMVFEVRLYFDDNGKCIEHKQNTDINDFDFFCLSQRAKAKKLLKVFDSVFD